MNFQQAKATISSKDYKKISLQFSQNLLHKSVDIYKNLRDTFPDIQFYLLADRTFGNCCVDSLTALHIVPDCIIIFGDTCFNSSTCCFETIFVFENKPINVPEMVTAIGHHIPSSESLTIIYDTAYDHLADIIDSEFQKLKIDIFLSRISLSPLRNTNQSSELASTQILRFGRIFLDTENKDRSILVISSGPNSAIYQAFRFIFTHNKFYNYSPETKELTPDSCNLIRLMSKRYHAINCAQNSQVFGILVKLPPINNYRRIVDKLRLIIKNCGKKSHIVSIGEITPEKLGNFSGIDIWVIVSCGYHPFLDNSKFYKPIITPFECYIALVQPESCSYTVENEKFLTVTNEISIKETQMLDDSYQIDHLYKDITSWNGMETFENKDPSKPIFGQNGIAENYDTEPLSSNTNIF